MKTQLSILKKRSGLHDLISLLDNYFNNSIILIQQYYTPAQQCCMCCC